MLGLGLLGLYLLDAVDKFSRAAEGSRVAFLFRGLLFLVCLAMLLIRPRLLLSKNLYALLFFVIATVLIGYSLSENEKNQAQSSLYFLFRYLYLLIVLACWKLSGNPIALIKLFVGIVVFNALLSWLGLLMGSQILRTYGHIHGTNVLGQAWIDTRFGFDGLILEQNNATYFYFCGFLAAYALWKIKKISWIFVAFIWASGLLTGTKTLWAVSMIFPALMLVTSNIARVILVGFLIATIVSVVSALGVDWELINRLLSNRVSLLIDSIGMLGGNLVKTLLLGQQSYGAVELLTEMDFVDLILFFGLAGSVAYLCAFGGLTKEALQSRVGADFFLLIIFAAATSGHFFYDPVVAMYFACAVAACSLLKENKKA